MHTSLALSVLSRILINFVVVMILLSADINERQGVVAIVTVIGFVHGRIYASARESLQRAIMDLKKDFISTLRSRPDPFCGDAERVVQDA